MVRRVLLTLTLSLGLLFGGLTAPAYATGPDHWCGHSGSHFYARGGPIANRKQTFGSHYTSTTHSTVIQELVNGQWRYLTHAYVYNCP